MRNAFMSTAVVAAVLSLVTVPGVSAGSRVVAANLSRAQIRSMPVIERPSRPGHFVGNAVRRRHERGWSALPAPVRAVPARPAPFPVR